MNWLERILIEAVIKMIEVSFKGAFKIVTKIAFFIMFCMYKLIKHYLKYAVPGVFKILWNPKYAPGALITILLCIADAKFFYKYTITPYYSDVIHLCIILSPFMYFYWVGIKLDVELKVVKKERVYEPSKTPFIIPQLKQSIKKYITEPNPQVSNKPDILEIKEAKKVNVIEIVDVKN